MANREVRQSAPAADVLRGEQVSFTGRLATCSRAEAARLVTRFGGVFSPRLTSDTTLLVVGQDRWPLSASGSLSAKLRRARRLERQGSGPAILEEEQFLERLGLASQQEDLRRLYATAELARLLGVPGRQVRDWIRDGLVRPVETRGGVDWFDFGQVAGLKTLCRLRAMGANAARLRRSLRQWARLLRERNSPLEALALVERGGRLLARNRDQQLLEPGGQLQLDFPDRVEPDCLAVSRAPRSLDEWFAQGLAAEEAGRLEDAAAAYRQALRAGGPDASLVFNLANVLLGLGHVHQAAERFWQTVELEPAHAQAWNNLGVALAGMGESDEALHAFRAALELEPRFADVHYNLADLLEQLGKLDEARGHWQAYLRFDSHSPWADYARTRLVGSL